MAGRGDEMDGGYPHPDCSAVMSALYGSDQRELTMMSPPPIPSNVADATNLGSIVSLAWIWAIRGL